MNNTFTTVLQDLVFGLFGAITLQVVIFSIFVDANEFRQDDFLCVSIDWSSPSFRSTEGMPLRSAIKEHIIAGVRLAPVSGDVQAPEWSILPKETPTAYRVANAELVMSLYFTEFPHATQEQLWRLAVPQMARRITVRTKSGTRVYSPGEDILIRSKP